jgi:hypothetical protein
MDVCLWQLSDIRIEGAHLTCGNLFLVRSIAGSRVAAHRRKLRQPCAMDYELTRISFYDIKYGHRTEFNIYDTTVLCMRSKKMKLIIPDI